jgi:CubicO group peptidase (beta-lactamase class C family)
VPQNAPITAEEILRRTLAARGGEAAAARVRSFHCKGTADIAGGNRCAWELLAARPGQARTIFDFGGGSRYEFLCDGQAAWETQPGSVPEMQSGQELLESRDAAAFFAWSVAPRAYRSVAYIGETLFQGTQCYELKLTTLSGREQTHYYNASNFFLAGISEQVTVEDKPASRITIFLEYQKFAGFRFPTRIRCRMEESEWLVRVTSVQVNCVDGSAFSAPAAVSSARSNSGTTEPPAGLSDAEIETMLRDYVDGDNLGVGVVVGLVDPRGTRVICHGKRGDENSAEVNGDTLFEIGSITKVFTHLLLHDMVARGEMSMDDPVQKYLPSFVRMPTRSGRQITLWDLSLHTSGLPRDMDCAHDVNHLYEFLSRCKLRRDPGEQFEYSNLGVALLGHVIALRAGQDYEALVRERICRPLKMDSTVITLTPGLEARRAVGHAPANRAADYIGLKNLPGAGALFSTANDMLKLASAKLGLTSVALTPLVKKAVPGHTGGTYGFSSLIAFDLKEHRAIVVLSNCRAEDDLEQFRVLLRNKSPKPADTVPLGAEVLDRHVGQYCAGEDRLRVVHRDGTRLLLQEWGRPSCELFPLSETNYYNQLFDCRVTFAGNDCTGCAREIMISNGANVTWRGARIPGRVLMPSASPLRDADCPRLGNSDLQGVWKATLRPWFWPFYAVHVKVRINEPAPGAFRAELDSPDLDAKSLPVGVIYSRPGVKVMGLSGEGSFEGKVNSNHNKVVGHWKVNGQTIGVTFRRVELSRAPQAAQ